MHIRLHPSVWSGSQATRGRFLSTYIKWIFTLLEQREHRKSEARFLAGNPNSIGSHREPFDDFEKDGSEDDSQFLWAAICCSDGDGVIWKVSTILVQQTPPSILSCGAKVDMKNQEHNQTS